MARARSSRREALTMGLLASGLAGAAFGQEVREGKTPDPPPPPARGTALKLGTVQIDAIFKGYEKVANLSGAFKEEVMARKRELTRLQDRAKREAEVMATLPEGTAAHAECAAKIEKLKGQHEELREKYEAEFTRREAEMLAQLYKEIRSAIGVIARQRELTMVVRLAADPTPTDPKAVMSSIEQWLLYADSSIDITREVIVQLNRGD